MSNNSQNNQKTQHGYRLIASDLDGTLLGRDQKVSPENKAAIATLSEMGVHFVPSTGRCFSELPEDVRNFETVRYYSTSDGAAVYDKYSGKPIVTRYIPSELVNYVMDVMADYDVYHMVHSGGDSYYDLEKHNEDYIAHTRLNPYFRVLIEKENIPKASTREYEQFVRASEEVELFCSFFASDADMEECRKRLLATGKLAVAQSDKCNLEVYSVDAGKGNALAALADALGVNIADTVAMGDSTNDLSLLGSAGLALAMENACDELKSAADAILCHYSEHCAKVLLERYFK